MEIVYFVNDFGLDSLDIVEVVMVIEEVWMIFVFFCCDVGRDINDMGNRSLVLRFLIRMLILFIVVCSLYLL